LRKIEIEFQKGHYRGLRYSILPVSKKIHRTTQVSLVFLCGRNRNVNNESRFT